MAFGYSTSITLRQRLRNSWVLGRFSPLVPSSSNRYGTASSRKPSSPRSSQNRRRVDHLVADGRVLEVQIRLVGEEAVPEVLFAHRVEGPVARLGVDEDDRARRDNRCRRPARRSSRRTGPSGCRRDSWNHWWASEVWFITRSMITRMPALVRGIQQCDEILDGAELGQNLAVIGDVVSAVAQWRVVERRQPQAVDAEPGQVVEFVDQAAQVTGAVAVGVGEGPDQHLVEDRALVPLAVVLAAGDRPGGDEVAGHGFVDGAVGGLYRSCSPFSVLVKLSVPGQPDRVTARRLPMCCSRTGRIDSSRGRVFSGRSAPARAWRTRWQGSPQPSGGSPSRRPRGQTYR